MQSKIVWLIIKHYKKMWVRVISFAVLALVTAIMSQWFGRFFPDDWSVKIGADAVGNVLNILASSMLAVTTFSLGIAVSAFSAAASNATPRATALLQEDATAQNVLATFLGAFLFSLVGIIAMQAGYYSDNGRVILFVSTAVVIVLMVLRLLQWINHLMTFGRMVDTLDRVERAALKSFKKKVENPYLGGRPYEGLPPEKSLEVFSSKTGYIVHIDLNSLQNIAEKYKTRIWISSLPGAFVHQARPLVYVEKTETLEEEALAAIRSDFLIESDRTFDQDFRFGLVVMTEIASRALSPGINDAGTAISVIGRLIKILSLWQKVDEIEIKHDLIFVPEVSVEDALNDAFSPIARDGATTVEIQIKLQKALKALSAVNPDLYEKAALKMSLENMTEARKNLTARELEILEAV